MASKEDAEQFLSLPNAVQLVEWLAEQGLGLQRSVYLQDAAADDGRGELVRALWPEGMDDTQGSEQKYAVALMVLLALQQGHLGLAKQLHGLGGAFFAREAVCAAATAGRREAVEWAVQMLQEQMAQRSAQGVDGEEGGGAEQQLQQQQAAGAHREVQRVAVHTGGGVSGFEDHTVTEQAALSTLHPEYLMGQAVESGSLEVVHWLVARGVPLGTGQLCTAAASGNKLLVEWVVGQGYDMEQEALDSEPQYSPYSVAAANGDIAMLRCLRRVGYPVPTDEGVFLHAVGERCCLPVPNGWWSRALRWTGARRRRWSRGGAPSRCWSGKSGRCGLTPCGGRRRRTEPASVRRKQGLLVAPNRRT